MDQHIVFDEHNVIHMFFPLIKKIIMRYQPIIFISYPVSYMSVQLLLGFTVGK